MYEDYEELDYHELELSIRQDYLEVIDRVILADLGRLWESIGKIDPHIRRGFEGWSYNPEALRRGSLGHNLLIIAAYADGKWFIGQEDVEESMKLVYQTLFGNSLTDDYTLPPTFSNTELGKLFDEADTRKYDIGELISTREACTLLGISRQSLHDRAKEGKLRRFCRNGGCLFVLAEIKAWKVEREQRRNRSRS